MSPFSRVRVRLAAWNLAVFALVLLATLGAAALAIVRARDEAVVRELRLGASREVVRLLRAQHEAREGHDEGEAHEAHEAHEEALDQGERSDLWVSWAGEDGALARRASLPGLVDERALAAALRGEETIAELDVDGVSFRVLTVPARHEGAIAGAVQVSKPLVEERRQRVQTLLALALTGVLGLLVALAASFFLAGRAMLPIGQAFERQRRFIADASHELRTPVAVLRGRAELLRREHPGLPAGVLGELDALERDAGELAQLLADLLDLARLDEGETQLSLEPVALVDAIEELCAQLSPLAEARGVTLVLHTTTPVWAETHLGKLRQVLRIFLDNALRHSPEGGEVTIELDRAGDRARVRVRDRGAGIAPEHLPRIFDRFYRADEARSGAGVGLGLAIAAELSRLLRAEIRVESEPGKGTTMISRPRLAPAPEPPPEALDDAR